MYLEKPIEELMKLIEEAGIQLMLPGKYSMRWRKLNGFMII